MTTMSVQPRTPIRLLVMDLDGTLLPHGGVIAERTIDAIRAAQVVPAFRAAIVIHMVEISPTLQQRQQFALSGLNVPTNWHQSFDEVPDGPIIVLANEFFDAMPVNQAVKQFNGWYERVIEIDDNGNLVFGIANEVIPLFEQLVPAIVRDAPIGAIYEWRTDSLPLALGQRVAAGREAQNLVIGHHALPGVHVLQAHHVGLGRQVERQLAVSGAGLAGAPAGQRARSIRVTCRRRSTSMAAVFATGEVAW